MVALTFDFGVKAPQQKTKRGRRLIANGLPPVF
jgi:hypothetical protein